ECLLLNYGMNIIADSEQLEKSEAEIWRKFKSSPDSIDPQIACQFAELPQNNWHEIAIRWKAVLMAFGPGSLAPHSLLRASRALHKVMDYGEAEELLNLLLRQAPDFFPAYYEMM